MKYAVIVAGGTGGHINAALAIGEALQSESWDIQYLTGKRPLDYKLFKNQKVKHLNSKPLRTKNPLQLLSNLFLNLLSFFTILMKFISHRPSFIVGAGGYVCGPTLWPDFYFLFPFLLLNRMQ